jgi:hypothetical protein
MTVDIPAIWTKAGDLVREGTEIDLGSHVWPNPTNLNVK